MKRIFAIICILSFTDCFFANSIHQPLLQGVNILMAFDNGSVMSQYNVQSPPTIQAKYLYALYVAPDQISLAWTRGNGNECIVFIKQDGTGNAQPLEATTYTANSQYGVGSQINSSGWYCVYKGTENRDTIKGLQPMTMYRMMVMEFNGTDGNETYLTSASGSNSVNLSTPDGVPGFIEFFVFTKVYSTCFSYSRTIVADGSANMISHGVCWATHADPTLDDSIHINGSEIGSFNCLAGHLNPNTTYHVRTFVMYPSDTVYGKDRAFTSIDANVSVAGAYDMLIPTPYYKFGNDPNNWIFGSIAGGDANKGGDLGDQHDINEIQTYQFTATNYYYLEKWTAFYEAITRCNDAIVAISKSESMDSMTKNRKLAELNFLRAFYYFELIKVFGPKLSWIDEKNMQHDTPIPNDVPIWSKVENDFMNSISSLPDISDSTGHANVWAAKAFYAKLLLFQKKYNEAKVLFDDIIANGKTTSGDRYALAAHFDDNFNIQYNNNSESVFAQQPRIDGIFNYKANPGYCIAYPYGDPGGCCGFFQPSQSLVNSFKVDAVGLPLFNASHKAFPYNNSNLKSDDGIPYNFYYTPDTVTPVDPRLDWTIGRRGIPYLDWGINPGSSWVRDQQYGGPYLPMKNVYRKADEQSGRACLIGGWAPGSELNYNLIRFADVLLMAAECEVELGNMNLAQNYVNQVRLRAGNSHVKNEGKDAAKYLIGAYSTFPNQQFAREAVRFERKLELAMEGHRFFDIVRWGNDYAYEELNYGYLAHESLYRTQFWGASFDTCNKYFPIPQSVNLYLPPTKNIGDPAFRLNAESPSGLPVSFSSSDSSIVKVKGDMLYIVGAGTATITAYQSVNDYCIPLSTDTKVITINPGIINSVKEPARTGRLQLFPNPTSGIVNIILPERNEKDILTVVDAKGRIVSQQNISDHYAGILKLDLGDFAPGIYIIILKNKKKISYGEIILMQH